MSASRFTLDVRGPYNKWCVIDTWYNSTMKECQTYADAIFECYKWNLFHSDCKEKDNDFTDS